MHIILVAVVAFLVFVIWSQSYRTKARPAIGAEPERQSESSRELPSPEKAAAVAAGKELMKPGIAVSDPRRPASPKPTSENIVGRLESVLTKS